MDDQKLFMQKICIEIIYKLYLYLRFFHLIFFRKIPKIGIPKTGIAAIVKPTINPPYLTRKSLTVYYTRVNSLVAIECTL